MFSLIKIFSRNDLNLLCLVSVLVVHNNAARQQSQSKVKTVSNLERAEVTTLIWCLCVILINAPSPQKHHLS